MENNNYNKLKNLLIDMLNLDKNIDDDDINQDNIGGWDSSMHLNIIMEIEAQFKISFKIEEVVEMRSIEDIWNYLSIKL